MAKTAVLDGMIKRADFAQQEESATFDLFEKIQITQLESKSPILKLLRKPDFQRETNHWKPSQIATFIASFANGDLIPSLILWKSSSFVFVIDGGHRLSALRAWVENDYGDGPISHSFFAGEIPEEQKKIAARTRREVEKEIGRYSDYVRSMDVENEGDSAFKLKAAAATIFTKAIPIQWIQGSQEVAEASFFKINSQGTELDKTEELILRNRKKSYALAARAVVRSGTGHKYWSKFDEPTQTKIEELSGKLFGALFQPYMSEPIKTLDLPLGGSTSPVDALKMLIDMFGIVDGKADPTKAISELDDDVQGKETIGILKKTDRVVGRLTGNAPPSLGLHPAVYFYNDKGKHSRYLFLGTLKHFAERIGNNDDSFFRHFTESRKSLERVLIQKKAVINQALANVNSRQRIDRVSNLLGGLVDYGRRKAKVGNAEILTLLGLQGKITELKLLDPPETFSTDTKSAVYLAESLRAANRCPLCDGLLDTAKSASYDHIIQRRSGGAGSVENCQITHPYCNSIKE
ncbi:MAG: DUF262 domain-containing protein [Pirellulaceae bacterium]